MLALENDVYFFHAVAIATAVIGIFTTLFAVAGPVAEGRYLGLVLWLCILASLAVGFARCAHADALGEREHGQQAAVVVTAVLDTSPSTLLRCLHSLPHGVGKAQEDDAKQEATKRSLRRRLATHRWPSRRLQRDWGLKVCRCSRCSRNARL